jgi:hypothetical protein
MAHDSEAAFLQTLLVIATQMTTHNGHLTVFALTVGRLRVPTANDN